jgi:lipid A 3-O-deacylase
VKKIIKCVGLAAVLASGLHGAVMANDTSERAPRVNFQLGAYNVVRELNDEGNASTSFALEYQDIPRLPYDIQIMGGALTNTDQDWFIYAGVMKEFDVYNNLDITLSFAPGYYHYGDDEQSENLYNDLEFKSEVGIGYELPCEHRVGLSFSHISNASLGEKNPGVEILGLNYSIPLKFNR